MSSIVSQAQSDNVSLPGIIVSKVNDFSISGDGTASAWQGIKWLALTEREGESGWATNIKAAYSNTGIYFLFSCSDNKLTATFTRNNEKLWTEDVVEVFLWPDEQYPIYFEYEISPLNVELPLLISRMNGTHKDWGWTPWQYEKHSIQHKTSVKGGRRESGAKISEWMAEIYMPFELLTHFSNTPPKSGTKWRANMYRVDYDDEEIKEWSWSPYQTNFHDYQHFGTLKFE